MLFLITVVFVALCVAGIWITLFAGMKGVTFALMLVMLVGAIILVMVAQTQPTRRY